MDDVEHAAAVTDQAARLSARASARFLEAADQTALELAEMRRAPMTIICTCACGCDEAATTTDDGGNRCCEACAEYAVDEDGECVCSRDPRYAREEARDRRRA